MNWTMDPDLLREYGLSVLEAMEGEVGDDNLKEACKQFSEQIFVHYLKSHDHWSRRFDSANLTMWAHVTGTKVNIRGRAATDEPWKHYCTAVEMMAGAEEREVNGLVEELKACDEHRQDNRVSYEPVPPESSGLQCFECGRHVPTPEWCDGFKCPCGQIYEWRTVVGGLRLEKVKARDPYPPHQAEWITEENCDCDECETARAEKVARREVTKTTEVSDDWQKGEGPEYTPIETESVRGREPNGDDKVPVHAFGTVEIDGDVYGIRELQIGVAEGRELTEGPDEKFGVVDASEGDEPEPDPDAMMYLHERYEQEPKVSELSNNLERYSVTVGPFVAEFAHYKTDGVWDGSVAVLPPLESTATEHFDELSDACDAADKIMRDMIDDVRDVVAPDLDMEVTWS